MGLFDELKRRNVLRVAIAYIVVAWLVLQVADVVLNNITAPGWVFQVLMLFLGLGLPIAVIFAWAIEMTPEGLKREREVDRSQSITQHTGRKLDHTIIGVLMMRENGLDTPVGERTREKFTEMEYLEESIGKTGVLALRPFLHMTRKDLWQHYVVGDSK